MSYKVAGQTEPSAMTLDNDLTMTAIAKLLWPFSGLKLTDNSVNFSYRKIDRYKREEKSVDNVELETFRGS